MTLYLKHLELYLMCKHLVSSAPYAQMCGRVAYSAGQVNNNHIWSQWWGQKSTAPFLSRSMSDPTLYDNNFKNEMGFIRTSLDLTLLITWLSRIKMIQLKIFAITHRLFLRVVIWKSWKMNTAITKEEISHFIMAFTVTKKLSPFALNRHYMWNYIRNNVWKIYPGNSDVGYIVMLLTHRWWRFVDVGDWIAMLVTYFECWCPTWHYAKR